MDKQNQATDEQYRTIIILVDRKNARAARIHGVPGVLGMAPGQWGHLTKQEASDLIDRLIQAPVYGDG